MKNILYAFLLFSSSFLLGSCSNDSDTTPPTIEILKPQTNEVVFIGEDLDMKFRFTDEYGVAYYSYEIFHKGELVPGEFHYKNEIDLKIVLNEFEIDHYVKIPIADKNGVPTIAGDYILRVVAIDWYNNKSVLDKTIKIEEKVSQ